MFNFGKKKRKMLMSNEMVEEIQIQNAKVDLRKEYVKEVLKNKKLPIVLLDKLWHTLRENIQSPVIHEREYKLQELLKEQGKLNNDYKEYSVVKQNFLKQILTLSGQVQEGGSESIEELNRLHQSTLGANQKLEEIENRIVEVEREIEITNREIIEEIIALGYEYIEVCKEKEMVLEAEIVKLREEMLLKTAEKKRTEKLLKDVYNYLHSIVGREQIEVMDKSLGE